MRAGAEVQILGRVFTIFPCQVIGGIQAALEDQLDQWGCIVAAHVSEAGIATVGLDAGGNGVDINRTRDDPGLRRTRDNADRTDDVEALGRLHVASCKVSASISGADSHVNAPAAIHLGGVAGDRVAHASYEDAVAAVPIGSIAVDQVALAGQREVFHRDAIAAVLVGGILYDCVSVGESADFDTGTHRPAGIIGFDAVVV